MMRFLLLALLLPLALGGCADADDTTVLRVASSLDVESPVHQALLRFSDRLVELSDGTMRMDIYPSGQLGTERATIELLQLGTLDMSKVSSGVMENFVPEMGVFSLPYLFRDRDHLWQTLNGEVGEEILQSAEPYRMLGVAYYDAGFRSFYINGTDVQSPEDLDGLKIRVIPSPLFIQTINLLGGSATPLAFSEVYGALQQGIVDGAENSPMSLYGMGHYQQVTSYVLDEHSAPPDILLISTHRWNRMSEQQRGWFRQAAAESVELQRELWLRDEGAALDSVRAAGVDVVEVDKGPFRDAVAPIYVELAGTPLGALADRIQALPAAPSTDSTAAPSTE
ncbi:MAG: TRAP transporter substrate-binding protein DctP [Rhodothermaceae bacterium]|nr:TRAP transporter substrate-binding protein DctP [Rhodothermaceae bacterium]MBC12188.1 TRAP transporter substrate-binding protein DctP [Rhodothermaceae bacterium]